MRCGHCTGLGGMTGLAWLLAGCSLYRYSTSDENQIVKQECVSLSTTDGATVPQDHLLL